MERIKGTTELAKKLNIPISQARKIIKEEYELAKYPSHREAFLETNSIGDDWCGI